MKIVFLYGNCLKSGIFETGSENFKTGSKAHDRRPNCYVPNNDIYGPKIIPREAKGYSFGLVGLSVCPSVRPSVRHALFFDFVRL